MKPVALPIIATAFVAFVALLTFGAPAQAAEPLPDAPGAAASPTPFSVVTFDDRVLLAQDVEDDGQYNNYRSAVLKRNGRQYARTMRKCIARSPKPALKTFILVADISAEGKADAVAVKPDNEVANCFASGFSSVSYPKPPRYPNRSGFPVMMKIRVTP
jgi:hypothetical protein